MVQEDEFRRLFAEEAGSRLKRLSEQLLELEERGSDADLIAAIFRDVHNLKGSAAVVGLDGVAAVSHALEDLFEQLRSGERMVGPGIVDAGLATVDRLRTIIPAILDGEDRSEEVAGLERELAELAHARPGTPDAAAEGDPEAERVATEGPAPEDLAEDGGESHASVADETVADQAVATDPRDAQAEAPAPGRPGENGEPGPEYLAPPARRTEIDTLRVPVGRLDEFVRLVGAAAAAHLRVGRLLANRLGEEPETLTEFRDLQHVLNELQEQAMRARMVPVATITDSLHRAVRDLARAGGKNVRWEFRGDDTELDRSVLEQLADPLLHLVRNAVDHGIELPEERVEAGKDERATVRMHAMQLGSEVIITLSDDGRGIDLDRVRRQASRTGGDLSAMSDEEAMYLVFRSGLSTAEFVSDVSGRGVGLDVVRTTVDAVRGRIDVRSEPGIGTEFRLVVPITLAVLPCLVVAAAGQRYAIPMHSVLLARRAGAEELAQSRGQPTLWLDGHAVPVSDLAAALGTGTCKGPVVVVTGVTRRHALRVDELVGQRVVVVKGLGRLLPRLDALAGASVEPDGSILLVLDAPGLIHLARLQRRPPAGRVVVGRDGADAAEGPSGGHRDEAAVAAGPRRGRVLVVDDAMTIRELQRSILERAGYEVRTATDGAEALARLADSVPDLVLTDVEMPNLDGFGLTEAIRAQEGLRNVAVLILTSRASEEDRRRGLEVGADGYIVKSAFDESALLQAVERLLGART